MFTENQKKRLCALSSYQQLPEGWRPLVKMILLAGMQPEEAAALLELPNPRRTLESAKVQRVLTDYRADPASNEDWVSRLESVKSETPGQPENAPPQKPGTSAPSTDQPKPITQPSARSDFSTVQTKDLNIDEVVNTFGQTIAATPEYVGIAATTAQNTNVCEICGRPAISDINGHKFCPECSRVGLRLAAPAAPGETRCPKCGCVLCACHRGERRTDKREVVLGGNCGVDP